MWLAFLVVWFFCGQICSLAVKKKGRSLWGWFFIGFLFGPIGVLASLIVGDSSEGIEKNSLEKGKSIKCPYCAEVIKAEAIVCKHCGRDIEQPAIAKLYDVSSGQSVHKIFQDAIQRKDNETVKKFLDAGLKIEECDQFTSHYDFAAFHENQEAISLMLEKDGQ